MFQELIDRVGLFFRKDKKTYSSLYEIMGFYPHDISLYKQALMHKSVSVRGAKGRTINNERLEFLGDAVLDSVVGDIVFRHFEGKREGFLTNARSKIVKRETLNKVAVDMKLDRLIKSSTRSQSHNSYMCGNAFEALVGAIYLDRGYDYCMKFMSERVLGKVINLDKIAYKEVNFKSKLIEWGQKNRIEIVFKLKEQTTDNISSPVFKSIALVEGLVGGEGTGYSKKESEQIAAKEALARFKRDGKFIDQIFAEKSKRTAMEEEPTQPVPDVDVIPLEGGVVNLDEQAEKESKPRRARGGRRKQYSKPQSSSGQSVVVSYDDKRIEEEILGGSEMSLDDVSMKPKSREDIIAQAEKEAFSD